MDFGWLSLLPPLIAIVMAVITRRVILALTIAVFSGVAIFQFSTPPQRTWPLEVFVDTPWSMLKDHLWYAVTGGDSLDIAAATSSAAQLNFKEAGHSLSALASSDHLRVFYFTMLFAAMVGILHAGGSMRSLVLRLAGHVHNRRGGQVLIWLCGMLIFFDDYANTLLVGTTMRSTADRMRLSREKLAYLVDSTAAPVAGLSLISTWVATEIIYMSDGLAAQGNPHGLSGFDLFLQSMPYRFYPIFALVLVVAIAWSGRDFGPMQKCEEDANNRSDDVRENLAQQPRDAAAWTAIVAIAATIGAILLVLYRTGSTDDTDVGLLRYWGQYVGNADPYSALIWGGIVGASLALFTVYISGHSRLRPLLLGGLDGMRQLLPAMAILVLAWALSRLTTNEFLNTQAFLGDWIRTANVSAIWIPTMVFLVSGIVAFATGTSWGTMGLLVPLSIPIAIASSSDPVILYATAGAVLSGAIFGDHCSPISDTTVLSSQASGCDHINHVKTQMPYAMLAAGVSILLGSLPAGLGVSPWLMLPIGTIATVAIVYLIGRRPTEASTEDLSATEA